MPPYVSVTYLWLDPSEELLVRCLQIVSELRFACLNWIAHLDIACATKTLILLEVVSAAHHRLRQSFVERRGCFVEAHLKVRWSGISSPLTRDLALVAVDWRAWLIASQILITCWDKVVLGVALSMLLSNREIGFLEASLVEVLGCLKITSWSLVRGVALCW